MTPIELSPQNVENIVMAACSLHNFLRSRSAERNIYAPIGQLDTEDPYTHEILAGQWRSQPNPRGLVPLAHQGSNRCKDSTTKIRQEFCDYFNSTDGEVAWQWKKL